MIQISSVDSSPILIEKGFSPDAVKFWSKLGYTCEVEELNLYDTVRKYQVKWDKNVSLENADKKATCRTLVYNGENKIKSRIYRMLGYCVAKLFQLIPKKINFEQKLNIKSLSFSKHGIQLKSKTHLLYHNTGLLALRFSPDLLWRASNGVNTVLITGTNGKTTVTKMIHDGLEAIGVKTVYNGTGANLLGGISTSFIENLLLGKPSAKWAVIECDEGCLMDIAPILKPEIIVVTNICTESNIQHIRFENTEVSKKYIERAIRDSRPRYVVCGENIELDISESFSKTVRYRNDGKLRCAIPGIHNLNNVAAACTCIKLLGFDSDKARNAIFNTSAPFGRFESFEIDGKKVTLMLAKNWESIFRDLEYIKSRGEMSNVVLYMSAKSLRNGSIYYSGWLTDGQVSNFLKNMECRLFLGGNICDTMYQHFLSEGLSPTKLESESSIISSVLETEHMTYILYSMKEMWNFLQLLKPFRSEHQKSIF